MNDANDLTLRTIAPESLGSDSVFSQVNDLLSKFSSLLSQIRTRAPWERYDFGGMLGRLDGYPIVEFPPVVFGDSDPPSCAIAVMSPGTDSILWLVRDPLSIRLESLAQTIAQGLSDDRTSGGDA